MERLVVGINPREWEFDRVSSECYCFDMNIKQLSEKELIHRAQEALTAILGSIETMRFLTYETNSGIATKHFPKLRGITTVQMSTDEIMALTRTDVHLITP